MDRWYEPPVSFDGPTRTYCAAVHHSSPIAVANRYLRDTYPADWIIQCALETGMSINLLTTRQNLKQSLKTATTEELVQFTFTAGKMVDDSFCVFDLSFLTTNLSSPSVVRNGRTTTSVNENSPKC